MRELLGTGEREKYDGPLKIESRKRNRENESAEIKTVDVRVFAVYNMEKDM
jgi:hypothetical protein